jgi:hypothetical protein
MYHNNRTFIMKKTVLPLILLGLLFLAACTAGRNVLEDAPGPHGHNAGFLRGLWHGIMAPITFILSLITENISIYEIYNNGGWYDFGFVLGAGILFGGSGNAASRKHR